MTSSPVDFPVFDADNHLYETREAFTRHLPKQYKHAIQYVEVKGRTKIAINGLISDYIPNPTFEVVARPGAQETYYREGNPEGKSLRDVFGEPMKCPDWARNPADRLPLLDELGLDATLMFPTLASVLEERMRDTPEVAHAAIHSLNQWLDDEWTFNYQNRIFTTPVICPAIVDKAVEELEWALDRGAKVVLMRPAPAWGVHGPRSPGLPEFDPFWALVQESGVLVAFHGSDSGYTDLAKIWMGGGEYLPFRPDPMRAMVMEQRPITDTMAALVCHGALARYPDVRIACVENGGTWVRPLLEKLEGVYKKMPQEFGEHPVEAFKRCVYVNPFWEDELSGLIDIMTPEHILFGSDYPHPEGLADPLSFVNDLPTSLSQDEIAKIMGGNLGALIGAGI